MSNRGIKSLENNFSVKATKNIINTPKVAFKNPQIATKPKIVDKSKIVTQKKHQSYDEYKNRVIKQLKKHLKKLFDTKKSGYLDDDDDDDDKEYKGIRELEFVFEDVNENDENYYKPERVNNAFKDKYREYESRGSQYYESLEEYLNKIRPYLENMIREYMSVAEWKLQLVISVKFISS